jgi:hypothetical protein
MVDSRDVASLLRRQGKRLTGWLVVAFVVVLAAATVYVGTPFHGTSGSLDAVEADDRITVERTDGGYVLEPATTEPRAGVVFYPGARVHPDAYVESLAPLVREGNVTVVIPRMPLNLAIFDYLGAQTGLSPSAATVAMDEHPAIVDWYVGGHSLGGAMACRYARNNPDKLDGLVLYGAYCDRDISERGLSVLSVVGTADTVLNWAAYEENLEHLPDDATVAEVDGMNHTQFGSYTGQPGDDPAPTSYAEAHARLNSVVIPWLRNETADR